MFKRIVATICILVILVVSYHIYMISFYQRDHHSIQKSLTSLTLNDTRYENTKDITIVDSPKLPKGRNFNPSLVCYCPQTGKYKHTYQRGDVIHLVFRNTPIFLKAVNKLYKCTITRCFGVNDDVTPISTNILYEDPRYSVIDGDLMMAVTCSNSALVNKQCIIRDRDGKVFQPELNNVVGTFQREKNWLFFEFDGSIYIIYSISPLVVYRVDKDFKLLEKVSDLHWNTSGLKLRGGTPPVLVGNVFYMVTHSSDYLPYLVAFSTDFRNVHLFKKPICGSCSHHIYFPCGLLYDVERSQLIVSLGIDDIKIGMIQIQLT